MGASEMGEPTPPIGSQISALAELAPDAPAVTCDGRTLTRAELDATTNRLARRVSGTRRRRRRLRHHRATQHILRLSGEPDLIDELGRHQVGNDGFDA